mmetsp:Transcript_124909/g.361304  ORF Transcript_124909/g.361304 Transcript_124909/m.361304 type:complete len:880 (+) Transcript_124909:117-2756(+)
MVTTWSVPALVGLSVVVVACGSCPVDLPPYSAEPSPFGWPVTPSDWEFAHPECWANKYPACGGHRQSPMDLSFANAFEQGCNSSVRGGGTLANRVHYKVLAGRPNIYLSKYMRAASVSGDLGTLVLEGVGGVAVEFEAVQAFLTASSLHTVDGNHSAAELFIIHKPKGEPDALSHAVVLSVLFKESAGAHSKLFDQMGIVQTAGDEGPQWKATSSVDIGSVVEAASSGTFYNYEGSVPVPPCSETVRYIVLSEEQPVASSQVSALRHLLAEHAGHYVKRPPVKRGEQGACREIGVNSLLAMPEAPQRFAPGCSTSPIDATMAQASRMLPEQPGTELIAFRPTDHVTVNRSEHAVEVSGEFGGLMLNGRLFEAHKVIVRPIAQHTFNGTRHVAELIVEATLFGERFGQGSHRRLEEEHEGEHTSTTHADDEEDVDAYSMHFGPHRVMLSIPLTLGRQNPLFLALGFGSKEHTSAIRSGNAYTVHSEIDLATAFAPSLSKSWYWYSGGPIAPGVCPAWGIKWVLFEAPLEMSLNQLNSLVVPISGMDSTTQARAGIDAFANSVPIEASEEQGWSGEAPVCSSGRMQSPIHIDTTLVGQTGEDNFLAKASWKPVRGLRLVNEGSHLSMSSNQFGYLTLSAGPNGYPKYYQVTDIRLRMPSEHMIDGRQYAAELQVVHKNQKSVIEFEDDDVLIASFLFDVGEESKLLKQLLPGDLPTKEGEYAILSQPIDLMWALGPSMDSSFIRYQGSHTTPGCEEVAQWLVFEKPLTLSSAQWRHFKADFPTHRGNRPIQPLNGRLLSRSVIEEYEAVDKRFFLNRQFGRDKDETPVGYIVFPIVGTLSLCVVMMVSIFQREDPSRKLTSAGGVEGGPKATTVGKGYRRI